VDNPSIASIADSGTDGAYDSATQTLTNTTGSASAHPRFRFALTEDLRQGAEYIIEGRFSGDISAVYGVRPRNADEVLFVDAETGEFSGTVEQTAASTQLEILLNAAVQSNISATIESMSVREVIAAPTAEGGWASGDYDRATGLTGDGTSYLDSGRANDADLQNDKHVSVYASNAGTLYKIYIGSLSSTPSQTLTQLSRLDATRANGVVNGAAAQTLSALPDGFFGMTRSSASSQNARIDGVTTEGFIASNGNNSLNLFAFARNTNGTASEFIDATIAFYSIGTSLGPDPAVGLADLDTAVTNLMADITFFFNTGLNPADYDTETVRYVNAGYAAGGTLE